MDTNKVIVSARDVNRAEEQAAAWFDALKKMTHDVIVANGAPRGGKFVTVGELSTFVLRSGDSASRRALGEMLERFAWITPDCAVWAFTKALLNYPEQVQDALIQAVCG